MELSHIRALLLVTALGSGLVVCFGPHKSVQVDLVDLGIPKNAGVSEANQLWSKGLWGVASNLTCTTECAGHEAVSTSCSGVTLVVCSGSHEQEGGIMYIKSQYFCAGNYSYSKTGTIEKTTCEGMQHSISFWGFTKNHLGSSGFRDLPSIFNSVTATEYFCSAHQLSTKIGSVGDKSYTETTFCTGLQKNSAFKFDLQHAISLEEFESLSDQDIFPHYEDSPKPAAPSWNSKLEASIQIDESIVEGAMGSVLRTPLLIAGTATCNSEPTTLSGPCNGAYSYQEAGSGYTLHIDCLGKHYAQYFLTEKFLDTCFGASTYVRSTTSGTKKTTVAETCTGKQITKPLDKIILGKLVSGVLKMCVGTAQGTSKTTET